MGLNKVVAVFLMCMFVVTAMHALKAEAGVTSEDFKTCYETCHQECFQNGKGNGFSFCEKKCDNDCSDKEIQAKLEELRSSP